ncbi:MAG: DUF2975 domain-containing protein [Bacteroidales bacterium]
MKKNKIYFLYALLLVVTIISLSNVFLGKNFKDSIQEGKQIVQHIENNRFNWEAVGIPIKLSDKEYHQIGNDSTLMQKTFINKVNFIINRPSNSYNTWSKIFGWVLLILIILMFVYMIKTFISLHKNLKRKSIFSKKINNQLTTIGIILLSISFVTSFYGYFQAKSIEIALADTNIQVITRLNLNYVTIILSLFIIFAAELLRTGLRLQEENELTI